MSMAMLIITYMNHDYSDADYDMHHNNADAKPYDIYMGWPPLAEDSYWH